MSLDKARECYEEGDLEEAARFLDSHGVTHEVLELCHDMMMSSYWESKDLAGAILFGEMALRRSLREAEEVGERDADRRAMWMRRASIFSYNLASFCWAGWGEPDIEIGTDEEALGRGHAETHLRLIEALGSENIKRSRGWWLKGAYAIIAARWDDARACFTESARYAELAGDARETLLANGYLALVDTLEHPKDFDAASRLTDLQSRLRACDDGPEFVSQLEMAAKACAFRS